MQLQSTARSQQLAIALYSSVVFVYVLARAVVLSVTYDEAWSLETYVGGSFWNIITFEPCDSNNHLLNSLLIKLLYAVLPNTLFVARIPSLIACLAFLMFSAKLCKFYAPSRAGILFFVLCSNPFMLDFFSLARGYSLALAASMASFYFLFLYLKSNQNKYAVFSLTLEAIAALAILSFLNLFAALFILILFIQFKRKQLLTKNTMQLFLPALLLAAILAYPLFKLTRFGNLYYGGTVGVYVDSYLSLFRYSTYHMFELDWMPYAAGVFLLIVLLGFLVRLSASENKIQHTWPLLLLLFCILINVTQVKLGKGFYLIDRTALFYYPLLLLLPFATRKYQSKIQGLFPMLIAICIAGNFFTTLNFNRSVVWFFDAETKSTLEKLNTMGQQSNQVLAIGCSWPLHKGLEYYMKKGAYANLKQDWNPKYYLYLHSPLDRIDYFPEQEKILQQERDTVLYSTVSKVVVYKTR